MDTTTTICPKALLHAKSSNSRRLRPAGVYNLALNAPNVSTSGGVGGVGGSVRWATSAQ
ncbi:MAG: hypothetical protein U0Y68_20055 [Blastocatellia bacterium]